MAPFLDAEPPDDPARSPAPDILDEDEYLDRRPSDAATCGHVWTDELEPDVGCLLGCGMTYEEWSVGGNTSHAGSC